MSTGEPTAGKITLSTYVWALLAIGGGALWVIIANGAEPGRAWRSLLINFLFFTSLAGGLVVWPAVVHSCNGRWSGRLDRLASAGITFALPSIFALVVLWVGSANWAPWYHGRFHQGFWLKNDFVFGRNLAALLMFWSVAGWYFSSRSRGKGVMAAVILILVYCVTFSLLGFDLVMALDPHWYSTLAGGYYFISSLYIAITGWAFLAALYPDARQEQMHDLGKLMVGFSLLTTYFMYSHLLPQWYENIPHETRFLVPRINLQPWTTVSYGLLGTVYMGPLVFLLAEKAKRRRLFLGTVSLLVLTGMWVERWWLVTPVFDKVIRFGLAELSLAAAFTGLLGLGMEQFNRRMP